MKWLTVETTKDANEAKTVHTDCPPADLCDNDSLSSSFNLVAGKKRMGKG